MPPITRQRVLDLLNGDWAEYVSCFQTLSPAAQADFLERQGYQRLADLLAHIVAWWQVGLQSIRQYRIDPVARQPEIDVDSFNARAVEQASALMDGQVIQLFESTRLQFADLIGELSDQDFQDERILTQIRWELVNHLDEHRLQ